MNIVAAFVIVLGCVTAFLSFIELHSVIRRLEKLEKHTAHVNEYMGWNDE